MGIAFFKLARCEFGLCQGTSVIGPACVLSRDRHFLRVDRQRAVCGCHEVVSDYCFCPWCHGDSVDLRDYIRLRAYVGDRAVFRHHHCESMGIVIRKPAHSNIILCQGVAIIKLLLVFCSNRNFCAGNLQPAVVNLQILLRVKVICSRINVEISSFQIHLIGSNICSFRNPSILRINKSNGYTRRGLCDFLAAKFIFYCESLNILFTSIIRNLTCITCYNNLKFFVPYRI